MLLETFLKQHDRAAWAQARRALLPLIHEVDRNATEIWFHFYPLPLAGAFARSDDPAQLARDLRLDGKYRLVDQIDSSHWFLYGHRYWPEVKAAVITRAGVEAVAMNLEAVIRDITREIAMPLAVDASLLLGISAVALMTLQQVGLAAFQMSSGRAQIPADLAGRSPARILAARRKDDRQGLMGWLRGPDHLQFTVTFDERSDEARFTAINSQHLTTASANARRGDYPPAARRCHEGPIPVECRTASCGTCWIGVLAGAERLSKVEAHEARRMKEFGYLNSTEEKPLIRLACQTMTSGNVTIVIPPWNGFVGKADLGT
jgi:ferredoxin